MMYDGMRAILYPASFILCGRSYSSVDGPALYIDLGIFLCNFFCAICTIVINNDDFNFRIRLVFNRLKAFLYSPNRIFSRDYYGN